MDVPADALGAIHTARALRNCPFGGERVHPALIQAIARVKAACARANMKREYLYMRDRLKEPPALAVCDSQVVQKRVADTPPAVPCTTFSILFARFKGDRVEEVRGVGAVERFTLSREDILDAAEFCGRCGYGSIVLQSGERRAPGFVACVENAVRSIKARTRPDSRYSSAVGSGAASGRG